MSRITFRDNGEEHNFWQNYTDLMAGLLIVFIIAAIVAYHENRGDEMDEEYTEAYKQIREFWKAQQSRERKYFKYDAKYQWFEIKREELFKPESDMIPDNKKEELINIGNEVKEIIGSFKSSEIVSFKVVIDGRAARSYKNPNTNESTEEYCAKLSYMRAYNLYKLWKSKGIVKDIEEMNGEVVVAGSGLEGKGRYPFKGGREGKNKTVIIQIIPYIKYEKQ